MLRALPGVGDLLCMVPAVRALRVRHPDARITLAGLGSARWFPARFPHLVDDVLVVDGVPGIPEITQRPSAARRFQHAARARRFDLALQLHGDGRTSNAVLAQLGARHQVTVHLPGGWAPPGTSIVYPQDLPEIERMLAVVAAAGCPPAGRHLELPLTRGEHRAAALLLSPLAGARTGRAGEFACVHAGASRPSRRWAPEGFAAVADHLVRCGLPVVLTGSTGDRAAVDAVLAAMQEHALDLVGLTGLGVLGALYRRSRLVVTNDTGASHVAVAVGAPSVVVSGAADADRWAPADRDRHPVVHGGGGGGGGPEPRWPAVAEVLGAVDRQLEIPVSAPA